MHPVLTPVLTRRNQGEACIGVDCCAGLTFVDRYRYDGLYVVNSVGLFSHWSTAPSFLPRPGGREERELVTCGFSSLA